ncbi:MAG: polysaccharide biosynthesis tyrosine autokinase [Marinilabilia sp.]
MNNTGPNTPNTDHFSKSQPQDLSKLTRRFIDKWYVLATGLLIALILAGLINKFTHPVYRSTTTLLVRSQQNRSLGTEAVMSGLSFDMQDNIRNEIGILKSNTLTKQTLEALDLNITYKSIPRWFGKWRMKGLSRELYEDSPIIVKQKDQQSQLKEIPFYVRILSPTRYQLDLKTEIDGRSIAKTDTFRFGRTVKGPMFAFSVDLRDKYATELGNKDSHFYSKDFSFTFHDTQKMASAYSQALEVDLYFKDASILELGLKGNHPGITTDFLNRHTKTFIESGLEEKNRTAAATIDFIDNQISGISDSLQEAESEFEEFRSQNRVINISSKGEMAMEKLEELISQKSELQRMSKYYDYLYDYIQNRNEFDDVIVPSTMGIDDQSLNDLVGRLGEAYSTRRSLLMTARENSPQVRQVNAEIESIRESLTKNVRNIVNATTLELEEINNQIEEVNQQITQLPGTERKYLNIQRDFQLNDNIYTFLLEKRSEAGIALASNAPDHKVIDPAIEKNTPQTAPRSLANLIVAGLLGLLLPAIGLVIGDSLNTRINAGFDLEEHTPVPILGHIEHSRSNKKLPVLASPRSPLAESFRALRINIDFMLGKHHTPAVLALSSSVSGEGKSFCSANLGAILAITGKRVLVVGMDLRKPRTHNEFNINNNMGLSNFLIGSASFGEIVVQTDEPELSVIPSGPVPPNPSELLQSEQMAEFLAEARKAFDIIILDTPPLALVADTLLVTEMTDLNLFILRQGYSRKQAIRFINHLHNTERIKKVGLIINDIRGAGPYTPGSGYAYGYAYGRFKNSGYYDKEK